MPDSCFVTITKFYHLYFMICFNVIIRYIVTIPDQQIIIDLKLIVATNLKKFTILYRGPIIWNSLPCDIRNSSSLFTFKKKMMKFLVENNL